MQSRWPVGRRRPGHGAVPAFFCRSQGDSADYAQANLDYSAPRRALYLQTNRLERAVAATDGVVAACHHHKSSDRGAFRKNNLKVRAEMEASTCVEIKRYVASAIGIGIIHDICLEPEDNSRFRTVNLKNIFPHPRARLVYSPSKSLSASHQKLIESFALPQADAWSW